MPLFVQQQLIIAKVRPDQVPLEVLGLANAIPRPPVTLRQPCSARKDSWLPKTEF